MLDKVEGSASHEFDLESWIMFQKDGKNKFKPKIHNQNKHIVKVDNEEIRKKVLSLCNSIDEVILKMMSISKTESEFSVSMNKVKDYETLLLVKKSLPVKLNHHLVNLE